MLELVITSQKFLPECFDIWLNRKKKKNYCMKWWSIMNVQWSLTLSLNQNFYSRYILNELNPCMLSLIIFVFIHIYNPFTWKAQVSLDLIQPITRHMQVISLLNCKVLALVFFFFLEKHIENILSSMLFIYIFEEKNHFKYMLI